MRTVLIHTDPMDAVAAPCGVALDPGYVSLAALAPGARGCVVGVGSGGAAPLTALERRLLEFGFIHGEQVEILAEARPGRDPFVVRVGHTTLALRRREAQHVLIELHRRGACTLRDARGTAPPLEASRAGSVGRASALCTELATPSATSWGGEGP